MRTSRTGRMGGMARFLAAILAIVLISGAWVMGLPGGPALADYFQQQKLTPIGGEPLVWWGNAVAIDGDTLAVGARYSSSDNATGQDFTGAVYVYVRNGSSWILQQKLTASDPVPGDEFGYSIDIQGDIMVVGAMGLSDIASFEGERTTGAAYVFTREAGVWAEQQKLTASDGAETDFFGTSVAIDGDTIAVGDTEGRFGLGEVYVFVRTGDTWNEQAVLTGSEDERASFGCSVAVEDDTIVIGALGDDEAAEDAGAAFVFTRSGEIWSLQQKLMASDGDENDFFGEAVALCGDTIVVLAPYDDYVHSEGGGSAYFFARSGGVWNQQQKLTSPGVFHLISMAFDGETLVLGAFEGDAFSLLGSVFVYSESGGVWSQEQELRPEEEELNDNFGEAVAVNCHTIVCGATGDDDVAWEAGAAYVFALNRPPVAVIAPVEDACIPLPVLIKVTPQTFNIDRCGKWVKAQIRGVDCSSPQVMEIVLDGSGCYDPDGDPLTFDWTLTGPDGEISVADEMIVTVFLPPGSFTASLVVNDGNESSEEAAITFTLDAATMADLADAEAGLFTLNGVPACEKKGSGWTIKLSFDAEDIALTVEPGPDVVMTLEGPASGTDCIDVFENGRLNG